MHEYNSMYIYHLNDRKRLVVLLDPEKQTFPIETVCKYIREAGIKMIFVGGSGYKQNIDEYILTLKRLLPSTSIILFPGSVEQFSTKADALLFLSLLSSDDSEFIIGQHRRIAREVKRSGIETIPMGYILVDGGKVSSTQEITHTLAIKQDDTDAIVSCAVAGELLGERLIYLEAGSGAKQSVSTEIIKAVREEIDCPLIVGGGITDINQMIQIFNAGADIVVIGNYFEQHPEEIPAFSTAVTKLNLIRV